MTAVVDIVRPLAVQEYHVDFLLQYPGRTPGLERGQVRAANFDTVA
jgi:hypothetical protein